MKKAAVFPRPPGEHPLSRAQCDDTHPERGVTQQQPRSHFFTPPSLPPFVFSLWLLFFFRSWTLPLRVHCGVAPFPCLFAWLCVWRSPGIPSPMKAECRLSGAQGSFTSFVFPYLYCLSSLSDTMTPVSCFFFLLFSLSLPLHTSLDANA